MIWEIEYTDEFEEWWNSLTIPEQEEIAKSVGILEKLGPTLGFPHSTDAISSKHKNMRELRTQVHGNPYRTLYAFDPRRTAILLIGGNKTGDDRWYSKYIPIADRLFDVHLDETNKKEHN